MQISGAEELLFLPLLAWMPYTVSIILGLFSYLVYSPEKADRPVESLEFVIVTVGSLRVRGALFKTIEETCRRFGNRYRVWVLVDEGSDLMDEIKDASTRFGFSLCEVPSDFPGKKGKGRALRYFVSKHVKDSTWYSFLDDDNLILDENFLYEIPFYEGTKRVVMNPVLKPRRGRSSLAYLMDYIRMFDDLTAGRFFTGLLGRPYLNFHGELLTLRGDILRRAGSFETNTLAEDFDLANRITSMGLRSWQSATRVSILSPNSLRDLLQQRGRWYRGIVDSLSRKSTLLGAIGVPAILTFRLSMAMGMLLFPLFPFLSLSPLYWTVIGIGTVYTWAAYITAGIRSRSLMSVLAFPILGVIENIAVIWMFVVRDYVVIDKGVTESSMV